MLEELNEFNALKKRKDKEATRHWVRETETSKRKETATKECRESVGFEREK
jgi:hypothetical protein